MLVADPKMDFTLFLSYMDLADEAVLLLDNAGMIRRSNSVAQARFGLPANEITMAQNLFEESDRSQWIAMEKNARHGSTEIKDLQMLSGNGQVFPARVRATLCSACPNESLMVMVKDFSEQRNTENQLRELITAIELKNDELENVIYITSHDLRSPLINIKGFGNELQEACKRISDLTRSLPQEESAELKELLDFEIPSFLSYIGKSISKMENLLNGLLYLSRIGRLPWEPTNLDMDRLVQILVDGMRFQVQTVQANIEVLPLLSCYADANHMNQILSNLIDNALKYKSPDRPLNIVVSSARTQMGDVHYTISDNGIGIASKHISKVFAMFYRLHPSSTEGEGIGLAATARLVQKNKGRIWVDSSLGQGSSFHVAFPAPVM